MNFGSVRIIGGNGPETGPITQRPDGVTQQQWAAHRREVFGLSSEADKIGGVPVETTVAVETFSVSDEPTSPHTTHEPLPIGWTAGDVRDAEDRKWKDWKNCGEEPT